MWTVGKWKAYWMNRSRKFEDIRDARTGGAVKNGIHGWNCILSLLDLFLARGGSSGIPPPWINHRPIPDFCSVRKLDRGSPSARILKTIFYSNEPTRACIDTFPSSIGSRGAVKILWPPREQNVLPGLGGEVGNVRVHGNYLEFFQLLAIAGTSWNRIGVGKLGRSGTRRFFRLWGHTVWRTLGYGTQMGNEKIGLNFRLALASLCRNFYFVSS